MSDTPTHTPDTPDTPLDTPLQIRGRSFDSRLIVGTGHIKIPEREMTNAKSCSIVMKHLLDRKFGCGIRRSWCKTGGFIQHHPVLIAIDSAGRRKDDFAQTCRHHGIQ